MNFLLRTLWLVLFGSGRRSRLDIMDVCRTPMRVWPNDIDIAVHLNNGRYFTMMDLGRFDLMLRCGFWSKMRAAQWYPVVASETIRFRRALLTWEEFELQTRVVGWDERFVYLEQIFFRGTDVCAVGLVKTRFLRRPAVPLPTAEVLALGGHQEPSPPLPAYIAQWGEADQALWDAAAGPQVTAPTA